MSEIITDVYPFQSNLISSFHLCRYLAETTRSSSNNKCFQFLDAGDAGKATSKSGGVGFSLGVLTETREPVDCSQNSLKLIIGDWDFQHGCQSKFS